MKTGEMLRTILRGVPVAQKSSKKNKLKKMGRYANNNKGRGLTQKHTTIRNTLAKSVSKTHK